MPRRAHRPVRGAQWLAYVLVLPFLLVIGAPFIYMVVTALTAGRDVLTALPLGRFVLTSAIFSLTVMTGQVVTSAAAAYAFARLRFAGRDRLFLAYLATLTAPAILLALPRFLLIEALGWVESYRGLITTELVSVTGIFLLRQFFLALPREVEDAARLEGAGEWAIFRRVVLPQSGTALATLGVLALAEQWRSFLWPLVASQASTVQVVEVGIANLRGLYQVSWSGQMALAAVGVGPVLLLYLVARKQFIRAIEMFATGRSAPT
ncbi:MAG TPA: carbohydrate ABC transporter permease [Gemmatimonadales bacterium]|nr:carbohydrate ABC transporter permease [Gemmatimonadales bacterium]